MRDARRRLDRDPNPHRAVDWWETGGVIRWPKALPVGWEQYRALRAVAREKRTPQTIAEPGATWHVHGRGAGSGRDSHCELRLETGPGGDSIVLHLDPRPSTDRTLYNFRRRITGDACVVYGLRSALSVQNHVIEKLGGEVVDEWVKRVDLCGDFYCRDMHRDVLVPYDAGRFVSSAKKHVRFTEGNAPTGLKVGSGKRLLLTIYDKLRELSSKSYGYRQCMLRDRWHEHELTDLEDLGPAVRVEYRLMGAWLADHGYRTALDVLDNLPNIARKISGGDDGRTFFMLTDGVPDKANGHQSRAAPSDFWRLVQDTFGGWDERTAFASVKPVDRSLIRPEKAAQTMMSYAAGIAVDCGAPVGTVPELLAFISANAAKLGQKDAGVRKLMEKHRRKRGLPAA
ncbi:hypothetical protein [Alienimonas chondri]|nr:hypothetical protein [Alienimonas chondri]